MTRDAALEAAADALALAADALRRAAAGTRPDAIAPDLVSIDEAAARLSISRTALYGLLDSGALRSHKLGRRRLVSRAAIEELIETAEVER